MSTEQTLVTPDFSQAPDQIEPGIYKMRIVDSKVGIWEGREGKPSTKYIQWSLETFGEAEDKNNGRRYTHRTPIEGKGAGIFQRFYKAAMGEDCTGAFDPSMLHSRELEVTIGEQRDKPEYTEVKAVKPITH